MACRNYSDGVIKKNHGYGTVIMRKIKRNLRGKQQERRAQFRNRKLKSYNTILFPGSTEASDNMTISFFCGRKECLRSVCHNDNKKYTGLT